MKDTIYTNGTVLTLTEAPRPEAVLVRNGKIAAAGDLADLRSRGPAELFDLQGHTLVPGFIDGHSHITSFAATLGIVQLEGAASFEEIADRIRSFRKSNPTAHGEWVSGFGYDHNFLSEHKHPDKTLLDQVCPDVPLLIAHASGHMGVANSAALLALGISANTPDPAGGVIGRMPGSREPNGYLEEAAFTHAGARIPQPGPDQMLNALDRAQHIYLSHGITTAQDGLTRTPEWQQLSAAAGAGRLKLDVVSYPDFQQNRELLDQKLYHGRYENRLKIGGGKLFLDGSPQGRTAWMTRPYLGGEPDYCGYPIHTDRELADWVRDALEHRIQLLVHCNGDAAADQLLTAYEHCGGGRGTRPVMIHAQLLRKDQLPRLAKLGMIASFFVAHTYYWGDVHLANFGPERAACISPAASAMKAGITCTFHQDTPVLLPDMLDTMRRAVERRTRNGVQLAENERISIYDALCAVTKNGAWQYFEESDKGTIEAGKRADFAVLDLNPLSCKPEQLTDIRVLTTIKDGEPVYVAD